MPRLVMAVLAMAAILVPGTAARAAEGDAPFGYRVAGSDRFATAAQLAYTHHYQAPVYVANGLAFPDALAAAPAAIEAGDGPVLLTERERLPAATSAAFDSKEPSEIVVLGGTAAVSDAVVAELGDHAPVVRRVAGVDRYETAALVALDAFRSPVDTVLVATGERFPDALSAGAAGALRGWPLLLVRNDEVPAATDDALDTLRPSRIVIVGDEGVVSDAVADRLSRRAATVDRVGGADRYATSAALARYARGSTPATGDDEAVLVTGEGFADALAAGTFAGVYRRPTLLTRSDCLPDSTVDALLDLGAAGTVTVGGSAAVAAEVTAGYACERACPSPDRSLEDAGERDERLCILFATDDDVALAHSAFDAEVIVRNESSDTIVVQHPSGCAVHHGRYREDGSYHSGSPACPAVVTTTTFAPGERRVFPIQVLTGAEDGPAVFAAGLHVLRPGAPAEIWFARERSYSLSAP